VAPVTGLQRNQEEARSASSAVNAAPPGMITRGRAVGARTPGEPSAAVAGTTGAHAAVKHTRVVFNGYVLSA
jgi:hypothetical protein